MSDHEWSLLAIALTLDVALCVGLLLFAKLISSPGVQS